MTVSVFDLFKLGIGPSSSHTMGPMIAASRFVRAPGRSARDRTARVEITLYASLALTGRGHATDRAVILGLAGFEPATLDPDTGEAGAHPGSAPNSPCRWAGATAIVFDEARDILWAGPNAPPQHPNALTFAAFDADGVKFAERTYFSIGGGFVRDEDEIGRNAAGRPRPARSPFPFDSRARNCWTKAKDAGLTIAETDARQRVRRAAEAEVDAGLDAIARGHVRLHRARHAHGRRSCPAA